MIVDARSLEDLEIIRSPRGSTLLDLVDRTATPGGRSALRHRLTHPYSSAEDIRAVQASVVDLNARLRPPDLAPLRGITPLVERYLESNFAGLAANRLRATPEALWIRIRDPRLHEEVVTGVQSVRRLLDIAERLAEDLRPARGRLRGYVEEMTSVIEACRPGRLRGGPVEVFQLDMWFRIRRGEELRGLLETIYEVDALIGMAKATLELGLCLPSIESSGVVFDAKGLFHPALPDPETSDASFHGDPLMLITGPNLAGKTTVLRAMGLSVLLAHVGMGVPARRLRMSVFDGLYVAIDTRDDLRQGVSYFQAEVRRVFDIVRAMADGERCFVIVDEMFRGTNPGDAAAATAEVFDGLRSALHCRCAIATHLVDVVREFDGQSGVQTRCFNASYGADGLTFPYEMEVGVSEQRVGRDVLRREGLTDLLRALGVTGHVHERPASS